MHSIMANLYLSQDVGIAGHIAAKSYPAAKVSSYGSLIYITPSGRYITQLQAELI